MEVRMTREQIHRSILGGLPNGRPRRAISVNPGGDDNVEGSGVLKGEITSSLGLISRDGAEIDRTRLEAGPPVKR